MMEQALLNLLPACLLLAVQTGNPEGHLFSIWAPHAISVEVVAATAPGSSSPPKWKSLALSLSSRPVRQNSSNSSTTTTTTSSTSWWWSGTVGGVAPGDGYVFRFNGDDSLTAVDPRGRDVAADGSCSVVPPPYTFAHPKVAVAVEKAVYYELLVGVFTPEGTLDAAARKLGYLHALGITVIELMPVMHSCSGFRQWGYCPRAPFAVRPELGGSLALKKFVDAAASFGMAVALDVVYNHASADSLLKGFGNWGSSSSSSSRDSAADNGLYFYSGEYSTTPWGPRPSYVEGEQQQYILDSIDMLMSEYHISSFRWDSTACIRRGGANASDSTCSADNPEGWIMMQRANNLAHRVRSAVHNDGSLKNIDHHHHRRRRRSSSSSSSSSSNDGGTIQVCEDTWGDPYNDGAITAATNDTSAHGPEGTTGGAGFDLAWGYPWHARVMQELVKTDGRQRGGKIAWSAKAADAGKDADPPPLNVGILMQQCVSKSADKYVIFTENHDVSSNQHKGRVPFMVDPSLDHSNIYTAQKKAMLGVGMVLGCRGVPMLLQGQELLTYTNFTFPEPPPFNWTAVSGSTSESIPKGMLAATKAMVQLRTNQEGHTHGLLGGVGAVVQTSYAAKVGVVHRWSNNVGPFPLGPSNDVVLVFNFGAAAVPAYTIAGMPYNGEWIRRFNGDSREYSPLFSDGCSNQTSILVAQGTTAVCIPPMTMLVFSRASTAPARPEGQRDHL